MTAIIQAEPNVEYKDPNLTVPIFDGQPATLVLTGSIESSIDQDSEMNLLKDLNTLNGPSGLLIGEKNNDSPTNIP